MIEWKGLFANTPYSSANNKAQDDAVVGMQDTIYATGPGYGAYRAIARVHNQSGAVVAEIPLSSGGGQLSAPPPVRILDDSTTYSYSLQVVEGAVPPGDADGVVIRVVGGASKRFPVGIAPNSDGALVADRPMHSIRPGCKGFRKIFGRLAALSNDLTNGTTYQDVISLEQDFDAIQIVIATIQTSVTTVRSAHYFNVCADANLTDAQMDALSGWAFVDWDENDGNSVRAQFATPAAGAARPRYLISQKKQANSIPRTDGGSLPLLVVRSHLYNNNATPTVCGNGTTDVFSNVARTDGRTHKTRKCTGNGMTTFSGGADAIQTPLVGIIYWSRGRVVNVAKFGDSIWQDRNNPMGDGWMRDEVIRRSSKSGIAYEIADFAWSGLTSANYHNIAMDAVGQFPIDIAGYPAATPNDIASGASLATATSTLKTIRNRHQEFVTECADNEVVPIIGTFAPVTTAVNNYTLCDQARIDFNNEIRALKTRGVLVADLDASLAGATVGGQVQPIAGTMLDGIHPGPVGRELVRSQQIAPAMSAISVIL